MSRIIPPINPEVRRRTVVRCREKGIIIPTFRQMRDPSLIPESIARELLSIGLWDVHPRNLFRITWKNDVATGLFGGVNHIEIPRAITGVDARIIGLTGRFFPTGAHKVGAAFGCLVPRLVTGAFDPEHHRAVWPSTGNYCRGGAFDCAILDCTAVAILPEEMSQERFHWLRGIGAEVIATPGCESNVKEIYDKCAELRLDPQNVILNQFDEFGNPLFHHSVTGPALEEVFRQHAGNGRARLAAYVSATGSAGTIAAGDHLKTLHPTMAIVASEALQCPTLSRNGFGAHRIEGIGDKHVPWVHNVRNTDVVAAIDDEDAMRAFRLLNLPDGQRRLADAGVCADDVARLPLLGISGICNLLAAIKTSKYFELSADDVILTVFTDSADMYQSRLVELEHEKGPYSATQAACDLDAVFHHQGVDNLRELTHPERRAIHNLKYYTWVEQQGKSVEDLNAQWHPEFWSTMFAGEEEACDRLIEEFNAEVAST